MKIVVVEILTLIVFFVDLFALSSHFPVPSPLCYRVFNVMCAHLSDTVYLYLSAVLTASCGFLAYMIFAPPFPQFALYESAGERTWAVLVIQYAHPHGPRLRGVHVLMKK